MFDSQDLVVNDELVVHDTSSRRAGAKKKNYNRVTPQQKKNENFVCQISYDGSLQMQTSILVNGEFFEEIDKLNLDLGWNEEQLSQKIPEDVKEKYNNQFEQMKKKNKKECCLF